MTISLTKAKVAKLTGILLKWPRSRRYALESEVRELLGKLLYASEVVRPGKFFVRRMLNQLGLPPVKRWREKLGGSSPRSKGRTASPRPRVSCGRWVLAVDDERGIRTIGVPFVVAAPYVFPAAPFAYACVRCVGNGRGRVLLGNRGVVAV